MRTDSLGTFPCWGYLSVFVVVLLNSSFMRFEFFKIGMDPPQSRSMKARFRTIPTLNDLHLLGPMSLGLDVLLVDTNKDKTLVKLQDLARVVVKGIGINIPLMIKKIAELVRFWPLQLVNFRLVSTCSI